jgi:predicted ester cyclase
MSNRQNFDHALQCFADPSRRQEYFLLYSDDIILHGYQGVEPGLESVKQFYNAFWAVFPDARVTVQELLEQADTLVARYVVTGTQREAFMGIAAAGQRIELPGISILHFRNGRCFERWACSDSLILLTQIGAPIAPSSGQ